MTDERGPEDDKTGGQEWAAKRTDAAAELAAVQARREAVESGEARQLVAAFVRAAVERGLKVKQLRARSYDGRATYRTQVVGWYLKRNGSLAVDRDANYYVMTAPTSLRSRFTGTYVAPVDPPLAVGRGARDGESMPLEHLLQLRLDEGDDWPEP